MAPLSKSATAAARQSRRGERELLHASFLYTPPPSFRHSNQFNQRRGFMCLRASAESSSSSTFKRTCRVTRGRGYIRDRSEVLCRSRFLF